MLGVIADTHGLFAPAIPCCFDGVDHIIHAGDIEGRSILQQLEAIAPVTAVSGNVDGDERSLPRECTLFLAGHRIAIRHVIYNGGHLTKEGRAFLGREQPGVCIFGHTHQPSAEWLGQVFRSITAQPSPNVSIFKGHPNPHERAHSHDAGARALEISNISRAIQARCVEWLYVFH